MSKALIIRQGYAVGDAIFITAMPRLLKQTKGMDEVAVCVMEHNEAVFQHNPYVDEIITIPSEISDPNEWAAWLNERGVKYDSVYAVAGHVEMTYLHKTDSTFGAIPSMTERREKAEGVNYQDYIFNSLGFEGSGFVPEFYFSAEEEQKRQTVLARKKERKERLVLWQMEGSSKSKILEFAPVYVKAILREMPRTQHFVYSSLQNQIDQLPEDPRISVITGQWGIRESIIMSSVADLVVGPESLWVNAAGAFDTPKICFFSHSAPENLIKHYKNAYGVIPKCDCHPCYLICTDFREIWHPMERRAVSRAYERECQTWDKEYPYRPLGYKCCVELPHDEVIAHIIQILRHGGFENGKGKRKKR